MKLTETLILAAVLAASLGCGYSKKTTPPAPGAMPTIAQLSPASASAGGPTFQLEVDGELLEQGLDLLGADPRQAQQVEQAHRRFLA